MAREARWEEARVEPEGGRLNLTVPLSGEHDSQWGSLFPTAGERWFVDAFGPEAWRSVSLRMNAIRVQGVVEGHVPGIKRAIDGAIQETNERLDREDAAREEQAASKQQRSDELEQQAARMTEKFREKPQQ